ncbi:MAG: hypothetical protein R3240_05835, partial [Gammaproteobacteria bacterium]|nr:hypothetical protein [Gammaproteobacteria bacterium]
MSENLRTKNRSYETRVYAQQVRYVFDSFNTALFGTFLGALLLLIMQWPYVDQEVLLSWFAVFAIINLLRAALVIRFQKRKPSDTECQRWGNYFTIGSISAGAIWAVGTYLAFPQDNLPYQLTVAIIIIGLCAGAVSTISILLVSFLLFSLPMLSVLVLLFIIEAQYFIALVVFFMTLYVVRGARKIYETNAQNVRLRLEADEREADLVAARVEAESANKAKSEFLAN